MKKSVLMSAAKKAGILLAVMTLCGMSFVNPVQAEIVIHGHDAGGKSTNHKSDETDAKNLVIIGTNNDYSGDNSNIIGINNRLEAYAKDGFILPNSIFGYGNTSKITSTSTDIAKNRSNNLFGIDNKVLGRYITAVGNDNIIHGESSMTFGNTNKIGTEKYESAGHAMRMAVALGSKNIILNDTDNMCDAVAVGVNNSITKNVGIAVGKNNIITGDHAMALGYENTIEYVTALAVGRMNTVKGLDATALGQVNTASEEHTTAVGISNQAYYRYSTALGIANQAGDENTPSAEEINHVAVGSGNTASGIASTAAGYGNFAVGKNIVSLGYKNYSYADGGVGVGYTNDVGAVDTSAENAVAFGSNNEARASNSIAFGVENYVYEKAEDSISVGRKNIIENKNSLAIGGNNKIKGTNSYIFGYGEKATNDKADLLKYAIEGDNNVSVGSLNKITANNAVAIGHSNQIFADNSMALGKNNYVTASNAIAIGFGVNVSEDNTVAFGSKNADGTMNFMRLVNLADGKNEQDVLTFGQLQRIAGDKEKLDKTIPKMGEKDANAANLVDAVNSIYGSTHFITTGSGKDSVAVGSDNTLNGDYATALGYGNTASGEGTTAVGYTNRATAAKAAAFGSTNVVTGEGAVAFGYKNEISGAAAAALGTVNTVMGADAVAFGNDNKVYGNNSVAIGNRNTVNKDNAVAIGLDAVANEGNTVSFGAGTKDTNKRLVNLAEAQEANDVTTKKQVEDLVKQEQSVGDVNKLDPDLKDSKANTGVNAINKLYEKNEANTELIGDIKELKRYTGKANLVDAVNSIYEQHTSLITVGTAYDELSIGNNSVSGDKATAIGQGNTAERKYATAIGLNNTARVQTEQASRAMDRASSGEISGTVITGDDDKQTVFAMGIDNSVVGSYSTGAGRANTVSGARASAFGSKNEVQSDNALAFGSNNQVTAANAIAIGNGAVADTENTVSFGNAKDTSKNMRLVNLANGNNDSDAATMGSVKQILNSNLGSLGASTVVEAVTKENEKVEKNAAAIGDMTKLKDELKSKDTQVKDNLVGAVNTTYEIAATAKANADKAKDDASRLVGVADSAYNEAMRANNAIKGNGGVNETLEKAEGAVTEAKNLVNGEYDESGTRIKDGVTQIVTKANELSNSDVIKQATSEETKQKIEQAKTDTNTASAKVEAANKAVKAVEGINEKAEKAHTDATNAVKTAEDAVKTAAEAQGIADANTPTIGDFSKLDSRIKADNTVDAINNVNDRADAVGRRVDKLASRVNKLGAGAAALAALHPMDYDPDNKLTFTAGLGSYQGEASAAIGAFYRPDEKLMFSLAGNVGNGEGLVSAGVSFAVERRSTMPTSKAALARKIAQQRKEIVGQKTELAAQQAALLKQKVKIAQRQNALAAQNAKIAQQESAIAELKAQLVQLSAKVK